MARIPERITRRARALRSDMTEAETRLWHRLRNRQFDGWRFRRQHPIDPYVADFACPDAMLVVEVDGGQHADSARDAERDASLVTRGWKVLRFWNNDVLANIDGVLATIAATLAPLRKAEEPPP